MKPKRYRCRTIMTEHSDGEWRRHVDVERIRRATFIKGYQTQIEPTGKSMKCTKLIHSQERICGDKFCRYCGYNLFSSSSHDADLESLYKAETGENATYPKGSSDFHTLRYVRWLEKQASNKEDRRIKQRRGKWEFDKACTHKRRGSQRRKHETT